MHEEEERLKWVHSIEAAAKVGRLVFALEQVNILVGETADALDKSPYNDLAHLGFLLHEEEALSQGQRVHRHVDAALTVVRRVADEAYRIVGESILKEGST